MLKSASSLAAFAAVGLVATPELAAKHKFSGMKDMRDQKDMPDNKKS